MTGKCFVYSPGNGPPVTGTFYPSQQLTCMFTCPLVVVTTNASNSSNVTANSTSGSYADQSAYHASLRRAEEGSPAAAAASFTGDGNGSFAVTSASASDGTVVSARVKARWLDYTRVSCVSPPRPAPSDGFRCVFFNSRTGNWNDVVFCSNNLTARER